ncbi:MULTISPECIES: ABC transporter ATP-binding protein [Hyphomicrobium]|uniref:ABC transporter ATP-binding protein n=1 Tax=Hyphomicrobium TaxID=81 RepID=UPI0022EBA82C|nr:MULTISPECIES: ABC transporter ATP-binding protein [Hyphomicrobium]WBT36224.1 ABC transporter ATP-binding protein [Hyphomicrobium sp. DMF-1]HML41390.1 ABC transporter ATP-binding protein [Hyphomicrobium zavarzinii]
MTLIDRTHRAGGSPQASAPLLRVSDVRKSYATPQGPIPVLKGVDLTLAAGESLALLGESGSGKSTLLHLIGGLDDADSGEIMLDGVRVTGQPDAERAALRRERIGIVFQQFNLVPSLTVAGNIAFQARIAGRFDAAWQEELMERLGLAALGHRYPEQLSGGQQQRVAIGRALAIRPRLLIADEPTGNLDEATGDEVMGLALDLIARTGCGFLMVTHSTRLARRLDRQVTLASGVLAGA